jgi:hypothetical protein
VGKSVKRCERLPQKLAVDQKSAGRSFTIMLQGVAKRQNSVFFKLIATFHLNLKRWRPEAHERALLDYQLASTNYTCC